MMDRLARGTRTSLLSGLLALATLALAACSEVVVNHGYVPPPEEVSAIGVGDTREAVVAAIGTPGSGGVMRDEAWFYTAYRVRNLAYRAPEVIERQILAVSFDEADRVRNIEEFGLEDGQIVQLSRRVTTSTVREISFLQQILGNFGQINLGNGTGGG